MVCIVVIYDDDDQSFRSVFACSEVVEGVQDTGIFAEGRNDDDGFAWVGKGPFHGPSAKVCALVEVTLNGFTHSQYPTMWLCSLFLMG